MVLCSRAKDLAVRRLALSLALLGCIIQAMVLPWHVASLYPAHWIALALASDAAAICHGGAASSGIATPGMPTAPGDPRSDCPICKALSGSQPAVLPSGCPAGPLVAVTAGLVAPLESDMHGRLLPSPRNRGPPSSV